MFSLYGPRWSVYHDLCLFHYMFLLTWLYSFPMAILFSFCTTFVFLRPSSLRANESQTVSKLWDLKCATRMIKQWGNMGKGHRDLVCIPIAPFGTPSLYSTFQTHTKLLHQSQSPVVVHCNG